MPLAQRLNVTGNCWLVLGCWAGPCHVTWPTSKEPAVTVGVTVGVFVKVAEAVGTAVRVDVGVKVDVREGVGVDVPVGVLVWAGTVVGVPVGQTGAITLIVPVMFGWMLQWKENVPAVAKTREKVRPGLMLPLFQSPVSLVDVCVLPAVLVQRTVEPCVMVVT